MARGSAISYDVHPAVAHGQAMIANLAATTGRALPQWLKLVAAQKLDERRAIMAWLKQAHDLGLSSAMLIAEAATQGAESLSAEGYLRAAPGYVEALFAGSKAGLRPLYEELVALALQLGKDVKLSPTKTLVPLYRKHAFAQLKPGTRTRLDLGLALGALKAKGRLIDTGGFAKSGWRRPTRWMRSPVCHSERSEESGSMHLETARTHTRYGTRSFATLRT